MKEDVYTGSKLEPQRKKKKRKNKRVLDRRYYNNNELNRTTRQRLKQ